MGELLSGSSFFCIALTIGAYYTGFRGQRKWKKAVFNPILIGAALVMLTLWILEIPVEQYQHDCKPLTYLMTFACLPHSTSSCRSSNPTCRRFWPAWPAEL